MAPAPEEEPVVPTQIPAETAPAAQGIAWWLIAIYVACGALVLSLGTYLLARRRNAAKK